MNKQYVRTRLFVVSSPSGGGKTTLGRGLLRRTDRLIRSVSMTTRRPRPGEKHGRDYFFVNPSDFAALKRRGGFLESARVFGYEYGTPRRFVLEALDRGRDVLLLIDVRGAAQVRRALPKRSVLIFIAPPSLRELKARLIRRSTDRRDAVVRRLREARREMRAMRRYDYVIENRRIPRALKELEAVITAERLRNDR